MKKLNQIHIMLDLETMGTGYRPPVIQIAAVAFNPHDVEVDDSFNKFISIAANRDVGVKPEPETVEWWSKLPKETYDRVVGASSASELSVREALLGFSDWIAGLKKKYGTDKLSVWGNGATFDIRIMDEHFSFLNIQKPWRYNEDRDMRTIVDLAKVYTKNVPFEGVPHDALCDCKHQIKIVRLCYEKLNLISNKE